MSKNNTKPVVDNAVTQDPPHSENENTNTPIKKKCKWLRRSLCILVLLIGLTLVSVIGVLSFESGQHWALKTTERLVSGLQFGNITGNLQQGLRIEQLKFENDAINVEVADTQLQWNFGCLWKAEICLDKLAIDTPVITVDTSKLPPSEPESEQSSGEIQEIFLPVSVKAEQLSLVNLELNIDDNQVKLAHFSSGATLNNRTGLTLLPSEISNVKIIQHSQSESSKVVEVKQSSQDVSFTPINWEEIEQFFNRPFISQDATLPLPFAINIEDLSLKNIYYTQILDNKSEQKLSLNSLSLKAALTRKDFTKNFLLLDLDSSLGTVNSDVKFVVGETDSEIDAKIKANINDIRWYKNLLLKKTNLNAQISGSLKNNTALFVEAKGGVNGTLKGTISLGLPKLPLDLTLDSSSSYPLLPKQDEWFIRWQDTHLELTGDVLDYQLKLQGIAEGMYVPKTQVELLGSGKLYQATVDSLKLKALGGETDLKAFVSWAGDENGNGANWRASLNLNKMNVGAYEPLFPAILSGTVETSGEANSKHWSVEIPTIDLKGSATGKPLAIKGSIATNSEKPIGFEHFTLDFANNHISAQGSLGKQSDLILDLDSPNLSGLMTGLSATLKGKIELTGNIAEPNILADMTGSNIKWQDFSLNSLSLQSNIKTENQTSGNLNLDSSGFNYGDIHFNKITVKASGNEDQHQLQLRSEGEPVAVNLDLTGKFNRNTQQWQGAISQTQLSTPIGGLKNDKFNVGYDHKNIVANISNHCWQQEHFQLCFPQSFKAGIEGNVPFEIKNLNLTLVNQLIEQELLKGNLQLKGNAAWFKNKPVEANLNVDGNNLGISQKMNGRNFVVNVKTLNFNTALSNNNLAVKSQIAVEQQGTINTDVTVKNIAQQRDLSGTLNLTGFNLNLFKQLLYSQENLSGNIDGNLRFAGSLSSPQLYGNLGIKNIQAHLLNMPFEMTNGALNLAFHGNRSTLQAFIQSTDSRLNIEGDSSWANLDQWNARVKAKADKFKLDVLSMAKLQVSPDIELKVNPKLLELSGLIDIPWARIAVESLPDSAVSVSDDEVILDGSQPRPRTVKLPKQSETMAVRSDLRIKIGDDVSVDAYGLRSKLGGMLFVKQEKGNLGLYGAIDLKRGRYASFGQDLLIRRGQITFNGLPSHPMLNIEAIRNPEAMESSDVIAGIKVRGLADSPKVDIFSEPSLPQDQALSYILTGRSLENSGETGSSGSIGAALLGLGLSKSGKAVGKIGETFGIQDLNLGTAGVGESSKVVVSGNITPKLQVKYGVGLFDGLAEFTLRYRLMPRLFLQSVSGVNQAFDVLYYFEF